MPPARRELCVEVGERARADGLGAVEGRLPVRELQLRDVVRLCAARAEGEAKVWRRRDDEVRVPEARDGEEPRHGVLDEGEGGEEE